MIRLIAVTLFALAACSALDAPVAQLERWQKQHAAGAITAIADEPVVPDCAPGRGEPCQRLHLMRAEACLAVAFADRAPAAACPGASAREAGLLACAASAAQAAEQAAGEVLLPARKLRIQARLCAIENLPPAMAAPAAREVITEAARCASVREAFGEARRGLLLAPDDPALKRLANDVALRAVRITDCRI